VASVRTTRLVVWLVLVPAIALFAAWRLTRTVAESQGPVLAERERIESERRAAAAAEAAARDAVQAQIDARSALVQRCLALADRASGAALRGADPLLVIVTGRGCGADCDADARASALADEWILRRLRVLLLRTREDGPAATPAGVTTLVLPQCAPLVAQIGDDYFLRFADGRVSGSGTRHEAWLRTADPKQAPPAFDPESLVAGHYRGR
jgi:hypothetical protein